MGDLGEGVLEDCTCSRCQSFTEGEIKDRIKAGLPTCVFIVCSICGNKRCPHAADHRNDCTGSNTPGQKGSNYE